MITRPTPRTPAIVRSSSGQSLTETVVMLPVLVMLLLGIFYMRELTATQIRAYEAARYVAWENVWYVREKNARNATQFVDELHQLGLGGSRLKNVTVLKRSLGTYVTQVSGAAPTFFLPQALTDPFQGLGGQGQNGAAQQNLISGLGAIGSLFNVAGDVGGSVARPIHDAFGAMTNWDTAARPEVSDAVYTAAITYDFRPSGPFFRIAPIEIRGFSSVLSHPFAVVRGPDNRTEYIRVFGDPDNITDSSGHIFPLWLFPSPPGDLQNAFGDATSFISGMGAIFDIIKQVLQAPGGLLNKLSFGSNEAGWQMPSGTLKEFPELHQQRQGTRAGNVVNANGT